MHLIVDHSSNQDNVRLLTEVGEQDLLNMIESEDKNTIKVEEPKKEEVKKEEPCLLYTSPSPRDVEESRMPSSA